jgi:hypothetical protein
MNSADLRTQLNKMVRLTFSDGEIVEALLGR